MIAKHGGKRAGSGRKKCADDIKRVDMVITVAPATKIKLRDCAAFLGTTVGRIIDTFTADLAEEIDKLKNET